MYTFPFLIKTTYFVSLPETWTNPTNCLRRLNTCQFHKLNAATYWSIEKQSQREFHRQVWSTRADEPRQNLKQSHLLMEGPREAALTWKKDTLGA